MASNSVRLAACFARGASVAALMRLGPGRLTTLFRWNTDDDTFEQGETIAARLRPELCDVNRDGRLFVHGRLDAKTGGKVGPYLAVSRLPYMTPLAQWECASTTTGGMFLGTGGLVVDVMSRRVSAGSFPGWFDVNVHKIPAVDRSDRTGWHPPRLPWVPRLIALGENEQWKPFGKGHLVRREDRYLIDSYFTIDLRDVTWADIDQKGRLVFARGGILIAISPSDLTEKELGDFTDLEPISKPNPDWTRDWPT